MVIFGAFGMLGHALQKTFPDASALNHKEGDITDESRVTSLINTLQPSVVINAAAYTNVDSCEDEPEIAFLVNGKALEYLAVACSDVGAILVHFSTDYIFDGTYDGYKETDMPHPINVYGASKLLGERKIMQNLENYRIIRTSWMFGPNGHNFVDTILRLSKQMKEVRVINDQIGKPTYTNDLASKTREIIDLHPGIYHITNEGVCSWYEFAKEIIPNAVPCSSDELERKARRPENSVLINTKTTLLRHWRESLNEYLKRRTYL